MTTNDPTTDESTTDRRLSMKRRGFIASVGAAGGFAAMSAAQTATTTDGNVGIGGGTMSDELAQFNVRWYEGPESELPEPGVPGQRYFRVTDDGATYDEGDVLVDEGDAWSKFNLGVGLVSAESVQNSLDHETVQVSHTRYVGPDDPSTIAEFDVQEGDVWVEVSGN